MLWRYLAGPDLDSPQITRCLMCVLNNNTSMNDIVYDNHSYLQQRNWCLFSAFADHIREGLLMAKKKNTAEVAFESAHGLAETTFALHPPWLKPVIKNGN